MSGDEGEHDRDSDKVRVTMTVTERATGGYSDTGDEL